MKNIAVLGCTGSIGRQTLDVIRSNRTEFRAVAICAGSSIEAVAAIADEFRPELIAMADEKAADELRQSDIADFAVIEGGEEAVLHAAAYEKADITVNGISGFSGTKPLLAALGAGKRVALANKESIVCAYALVEKALSGGGEIIPVDSEQSAIFQCLSAGKHDEIARLILTASGGPFREYTKEQLKDVTPEQAGHHPTWSMGRKITIDSASMFNKGLEIMEASYLFKVPGERISVLVHPESIVHSMVEYADGCNIAQLSRPDMRLAIQYALTYPNRIEGNFGRLRLEEVGKISFFAPDTDKFPALLLAYEALREGSVLPIVYNGANEAAVDMFIKGKIRFDEIADAVEYAMKRADLGNILTFEDIIETDRQARRLAYEKGNA